MVLKLEFGFMGVLGRENVVPSREGKGNVAFSGVVRGVSGGR